jgi:soluble cytochrome b562
MKNLWSKEDLANFNNSEVFSELEARVIDTIKRADILAQKIAQSTTEQKTKALQGLTEAANEATEAVNSFETASSADDEEFSDSEEAFQPILEELHSMAKLAIEKGDYKLAYKIERTIDEVTEPEIKCE